VLLPAIAVARPAATARRRPTLRRRAERLSALLLLAGAAACDRGAPTNG